MENVSIYKVQLLMILLCVLLCASANAAEETFEVSVQAFERGNRGKRFLMCRGPGLNGKEFTVSFTGKKDEPGTRFILKRKSTIYKNKRTVEFTLQPAEYPNYILIAQEGNLEVKNVSNINPDEIGHKFEMKSVTLQYSDSNRAVTEVYKILRIRSSPPRVLKSSKSGKVDLVKWKNWKDCHAWFIITVA